MKGELYKVAYYKKNKEDSWVKISESKVRYIHPYSALWFQPICRRTDNERLEVIKVSGLSYNELKSEMEIESFIEMRNIEGLRESE